MAKHARGIRLRDCGGFETSGNGMAQGMEAKAVEFVRKGSEIYSKA